VDCLAAASGLRLLRLLFSASGFGLVSKVIGHNQLAAQYSGLRTKRTIVVPYLLSGGLSALAGIVMMSRFDSPSPPYGLSYLLVSVPAAVLGGAQPEGGKISILTIGLAILILHTVSSLMNLSGLSAHLTLVLWGSY
jgi:simple sugar transport system permease protein